MAKTRIVAAVGAATGAEKTDASSRVDAAMANAVKQAIADGVSVDDAEEMRRRILAARDAVSVR